MNRSRLKVFAQLEFKDPEQYLRQWWLTGPLISSMNLNYHQKSFRTHGLRIHKDRREAALFCYGLRIATGNSTFEFAMIEDSDHDAVFRSFVDGKICFTSVQLKEVVPLHLDAKATLEREIAKLEKYADSQDLVVGIFLDQNGVSDLTAIESPNLKVGGVWIFGCCSPDTSKWFLFGNILSNPKHTEFVHPK
jgi:hypothetical protein